MARGELMEVKRVKGVLGMMLKRRGKGVRVEGERVHRTA